MKLHISIMYASLLAGIFLLLSGCGTTVNRSHLFGSLDIGISSQLEAELDINMEEKLSGTSSATYLLGLLQISGDSSYVDGYGTSNSLNPISMLTSMLPVGVNLSKVKSAAVYNAIMGSEADVLVSPQYLIKVNKALIFTSVKVIVKGYPGYIKDIRQVPLEDLSR